MSPLTTGVLRSDPLSATSTLKPPLISVTSTVINPPERRELLCTTALVTISEVSRMATSAAGFSGPMVLRTNDLVSQTCSARPGIVRLAKSLAPAIVARSAVASLASVVMSAISGRLPPRYCAWEMAGTCRWRRARPGSRREPGACLHDAAGVHAAQVRRTNLAYEISVEISYLPRSSGMVSLKVHSRTAVPGTCQEPFPPCLPLPGRRHERVNRPDSPSASTRHRVTATARSAFHQAGRSRRPARRRGVHAVADRDGQGAHQVGLPDGHAGDVRRRRPWPAPGPR